MLIESHMLALKNQTAGIVPRYGTYRNYVSIILLKSETCMLAGYSERSFLSTGPPQRCVVARTVSKTVAFEANGVGSIPTWGTIKSTKYD